MDRLPSGSPLIRLSGNSTNFAGQTSRSDWLSKRDEARMPLSHVVRHRPASIHHNRNASGLKRLQHRGDHPVCEVHIQDGHIEDHAIFDDRPRFFGTFALIVSDVAAAFAAFFRCWPRPKLLASSERFAE
jgi:hypothetical protein